MKGWLALEAAVIAVGLVTFRLYSPGRAPAHAREIATTWSPPPWVQNLEALAVYGYLAIIVLWLLYVAARAAWRAARS